MKNLLEKIAGVFYKVSAGSLLIFLYNSNPNAPYVAVVSFINAILLSFIISRLDIKK